MAQPFEVAFSSPQKTTGKKTRKAVKAKPKGLPTSGARLEQYLKDPGLRSKLPDEALTAALLASRKQNQYNAAPAAPGSGYTNKQLNDLVAMQERQKFGGQEAALGLQGQQLATRYNSTVPAYFDQYRSIIASQQQAQQAAAAAQVGSLQALATQAAGDTGTPAGATAQDAQRGQAAAQMRGAGIGNQAAVAQNLGALQSQYLGNVSSNSLPLQASVLQQVFGQQQQNLSDKAQLAGAKGDFGVQQRSQILSDEGDAALKAALTGSQITQNTAGAQASLSNASTAASNAKTTAQRAKVDAANKKASLAEGVRSHKANETLAEKRIRVAAEKKKASKKPASGPGSLPAASEAKVVSQINKYADILKRGEITVADPITGVKTTKQVGAKAALQWLQQQNVDPHALNVARSLYHGKGKIGKWGVKEAHHARVHVGGNWDIA